MLNMNPGLKSLATVVIAQCTIKPIDKKPELNLVLEILAGPFAGDTVPHTIPMADPEGYLKLSQLSIATDLPCPIRSADFEGVNVGVQLETCPLSGKHRVCSFMRCKQVAN